MPLSLTRISLPPVPSRITLRIWRWLPSNGAQWLYTYSGTLDHAVLGTLMQTVRQLTAAVPGDWLVDVAVTDLERGLLRAVRDDLLALRERGVRPVLRRVPRLRRRWRARTAAPPAATLLH